VRFCFGRRASKKGSKSCSPPERSVRELKPYLRYSGIDKSSNRECYTGQLQRSLFLEGQSPLLYGVPAGNARVQPWVKSLRDISVSYRGMAFRACLRWANDENLLWPGRSPDGRN